MTTWVLHYCRGGRWRIEDWIYSDLDAAMYWAENYMTHDADAVVIEDITHMNKQQKTGFLQQETRARHGGGRWSKNPETEDPWNFDHKDFFKGVRVRERHRKKYRQE